MSASANIMERRRPHHKAGRPISLDYETQDCPFLKLPAELRNTIYGLVCTRIDTVPILPGPPIRILKTAHPLSRTCRQLYEEFSPVYEANVPIHATQVFCRITNFGVPDKKAMAKYLRNMPEHPRKWPRQFMQELYLDNTFNKNINVTHLDLFKSFKMDSDWTSPQTRVYFNSKSFDVEFLRGFMNQFVGIPRKREDERIVWNAVDEALRQHDLRKASLAKARAKKRRSSKRRPEGTTSPRVKVVRPTRERRAAVARASIASSASASQYGGKLTKMLG